ncbi:hypothetical protein [Isoptericola sp. NPDC060257]|uniref:hypothetical protein n=1 Tax=Isoptericola sp. NPDC060257 TaxID=3347087 RepID=UPI0036553146
MATDTTTPEQDETTEPETPEAPEIEQPEVEAPEEAEPETFPRDYVEKLRQESGKYRQRAAKTDELAQRLHTALVAATGRLADPSDLTYDEAHLDDTEALEGAISELLSRKPHLASRRVTGDVGQGASSVSDDVSLARILRAGAN